MKTARAARNIWDRRSVSGRCRVIPRASARTVTQTRGARNAAATIGRRTRRDRATLGRGGTMWWVAEAMAADPATQVAARLAETKDLRALRLAPGPPELTESTWKAAANGQIPTGVIGVDGVS